MNAHPVFSVIVPYYNRPEQVSEAVRSVLSQTFGDFEIIVIDDGSDVRFDDQYIISHPRVQIRVHSENRGAPAARNTGIICARGDYVAFLDADDVWLPEKLERQFDAIRSVPDGTAVIVSHNVFSEKDGIRTLFNSRPPEIDEDIVRYLIQDRCALQTSSLVVSREFALENKFREQIRRHQDWDFVIRAIHAGARLLYIDKALSVYRLNDDKARISLHPRSFELTLDWFMQSRDIVPVDLMQSYFGTTAIGKNVIRYPVSTASAFLKVASMRPSRLPLMIWLVIQSQFGKLKKKFGTSNF